MQRGLHAAGETKSIFMTSNTSNDIVSGQKPRNMSTKLPKTVKGSD